jgi:signal transduction histidine kinase
MGTIKILLVEDHIAEARLLQEILKGAKFKEFFLVHTNRLGEALERLAREDFAIILLDLTLPDSQGLGSLKPLIDKAPQIPIVVLTNTNDEQLALEAVRCGAQDYLVKREVNLDILVRSICYAIERKQTEEALRESKASLEIRVRERTAELVKAQELNQLKNEFVSMISHDFRNPLNTILLSAGLLQDSGDRLTKDQQLSYFRLIRTAIKDMDQLLTEVLLIGKAESGKLHCQLDPINLEDFCRRLVGNLQLNMEKKHTLIFRPEGNLQQGLWDVNILRHILNNLLGNAFKYSPEGGLVEFDLSEKGDRVVFRIQDQGIGIPQADLERLFKPFYRASNVDNIPGTGLGLAIVWRCVEALGGSIVVHSQVDEGTEFIVTLPIVNEETHNLGGSVHR